MNVTENYNIVYSCGLSTVTIEYSYPSMCFGVYLSVCLSSCVFQKRNYRVPVRVCVCVCVCVCLHDNSKRNRSRNMKFEYIVVLGVYENSSDEFDMEHHRIKVKVTVGLQKFSPFNKLSGPITELWYKLGSLY